MERRVVAQLLTCMDALASRPNEAATPSKAQTLAKNGAAAAGNFTGYSVSSPNMDSASCSSSGETGAALDGVGGGSALIADSNREAGNSAAEIGAGGEESSARKETLTGAAASTPPPSVPPPPPMRRNPVVVVGATCRPDAVDGALRRAGRFDREVGAFISYYIRVLH